jgi:hypothetical protein
MKLRLPLFVYRLIRYEYWPGWLFYAPIFPYWVYLSVRMRSFTFFTAANPGIELGGFFGESKQDILRNIPEEFLPTQLFVTQKDTVRITELLQNHNMQFPVIAKPDVGERGTGVEKLETPEALITYLEATENTILIQEFIDWPEEFGVFYCRVQGNLHGSITSLTQKQFLGVTGDGQQSVEALMQASVRARFQLPRLRKTQAEILKKIPAAGVNLIIEPVGNHCRGTEFLDANDLVTPEMVALFDRIADAIPGFHYGRFDIKAKSIEALQQGTGIRIMELNGVSSEPGHIYDKNMSLVRAYRDVARHWSLMARIARANEQVQQVAVSWRSLAGLYLKHVVLGKPAGKSQ